MKGPKFRLEPVLRIRRIEERTAALAAAEAARAAQEAEDTATHREALARDARLPPMCSGAELIAAVARSRALTEDASRARAAAVAQQEHSDAVRTEWTTAAQRTKALEKLEERHKTQVQAHRESAEARTVDDLVTRSYAVRQRDEGTI